MQSLQIEDDNFCTCCFTLGPEDIYKLDREDGPITNVIAGIDKHCYGTKLYDDEHGVMVEMFYINGERELRGDILQLDIYEKQYYELLLRFCDMLAKDYPGVDAIGAFNTFQKKLRGFLEKLEFFTVSSLELNL